MSSFVYLAPTGQLREGLIEAFYDQTDARYLGAEARLDAQIIKPLWVNLAFDITDAQIIATKVPLPRIPPARGRVGLDYRRGGLNVRPELILSNRQWQVFPAETPTAGYVTPNLNASYTMAGVHRSHSSA